jgi:hypothetical protein
MTRHCQIPIVDIARANKAARRRAEVPSLNLGILHPGLAEFFAHATVPFHAWFAPKLNYSGFFRHINDPVGFCQ